jgi:hypothetical protein
MMEDSARALALLARFGSVTVLNGHIHQLMHNGHRRCLPDQRSRVDRL